MIKFIPKVKLFDRTTGIALKEVKAGAKPIIDQKLGIASYADADMVEITHGQVAMVALDTTIDADKKEMENDPSKWVRSVMKRESISSRISEALKSGSTVELSDEEVDVLIDRLAQITVKLQLQMTGPVIWALKNNQSTQTAPAD